MSESLIHDTAWATAQAVVQLFACLRDEEKLEAFAEVYALVKDGIHRYEERANRMQQRLAKPSGN
jgi:hypothetical protein